MTSIFGRGPRGLPLAAVLALMALSAACGGKPEPAPVVPVAESDDAEREAAERARREAEERARGEAEERARREAEAARMNAALEEMVFFDYDQARLRPDAQAALERKLEVLRANPGVTLRIAGHADERGSTEYNLALGNRRAMSVVEYFTGFGLDAGRFQTVSFGEERPLSTASGEAGWARNRRAEFQITAGQIVSRQP